ncbi:unnamed protein product, partial [Mesorhabditis spiculigera]
MRAMMYRGIKPTKIFSSPALRCIQTACSMAKLANLPVCVEPGLFEPFIWYRRDAQSKLPVMAASKLRELGYPIDLDYRPVVQHSYFEKHPESELEGRQRNDMILRTLSTSVEEGPVLIIGHAITIHTAHFISKPHVVDTNSDDDLTSVEDQWGTESAEPLNTCELGLRYPPGCVVTVARVSDGPPAQYQMINGLIPPLTYGREFSNRPVHPI